MYETLLPHKGAMTSGFELDKPKNSKSEEIKINYKNSDYAVNKFIDGIVYRSVTGERITVTYDEIRKENHDLTPAGFQALKMLSDEDYRESNNTDQKETRYINPQYEPANTKDLRNKPPEEMFVEREAIDELNRAIESLTETQQRRIRLFYFEGLTEVQIADLEGVSKQNVSKSILSARKKLKKFFK